MTFVASPVVPCNQLLATLPAGELEWLRPQLSRVQMVTGQVLHERGALIEHAYFVESGIVSLVSGIGENEVGVEIGMIGRDGLVGAWAMFDGSRIAICRTLAQMGGAAWRIPVPRLRQAAEQLPTLRRLGFRFLEAMQAQSAQNAACNAIHPLQKRAARRLLMAHDRIDGNELAVTQKLLSDMLGVRRPGVTAAQKALQKAGLIAYRRGRLTIVDRPGLERVACGCYRVLCDQVQPPARTGRRRTALEWGQPR